MPITITNHVQLDWSPDDEGDLIICHFSQTAVVLEIAAYTEHRFTLNPAWLPANLIAYARMMARRLDATHFAWSDGRSINPSDVRHNQDEVIEDLVRQMLASPKVNFPTKNCDSWSIPDLGSNFEVMLSRPQPSGFMADVHPDERGDWSYTWTAESRISRIDNYTPDEANRLVQNGRCELVGLAPAMA